MGDMEDQLTLVDTPRDWKLDRHTREIGRKGVAEAREVLRLAGSGDDHGDSAAEAA